MKRWHDSLVPPCGVQRHVGAEMVPRLHLWRPLWSDKLTVPFEASDFPTGSPLNGWHALHLRWDDLLWASITVGKAQPDLMRFGRYSFAEMLHRVACFHAYYDIDKSNRLTLSPAYKNLDSTEKGVVSYYTGMAMAKLYADKVLNIPWMMHISRYEVDWAVSYGANTNRPDLFGCNDLGEWAVAEAKGRSRVTNRLVSKMQKQKSAVASIRGVTPSYRYGAATRFEGGRLCSDWWTRHAYAARRRCPSTPLPGWLITTDRSSIFWTRWTCTKRARRSSARCLGQTSRLASPERSRKSSAECASVPCNVQGRVPPK